MLDQVDIIDLISQDTELRSASHNEYIGKCPFHEDKNPSFSVNSKLKVFNCFGCHASGNAIQYVAKRDNISEYDALQKLADMYNIYINLSEDDLLESKKYHQYIRLMKLSQQYFVSRLENNEPVKKYLHEIRHLTDEDIQKFGIGFDDGLLYKYLLSQTIDENDDTRFTSTYLEEMGLIKTNNRIQDFFYNRITFPIVNDYNNLIGFSARAINDKTLPKYKNSINNDYFDKSELLYNFGNIRHSITNDDYIYLFEGQADVISASIAGMTNSIASLGTALTDNQISRILNVTNKVIICYDGDQAGQKATLRAIDKFIYLNNNVDISIVELPTGLDPDDYRRKYGKDKLYSALLKHEPIIDYLIKNEYNKFISSKESENLKKYKSKYNSKIYDLCYNVINNYAINDNERKIYLSELDNKFHVNQNSDHKIVKAEKTKPLVYTKGEKNRNYKNNITLSDKLLSFIVHKKFDKSNLKIIQDYFVDKHYNKIINSLYDDNIILNNQEKIILNKAKENNNVYFNKNSFIYSLNENYLNYNENNLEEKLNQQLLNHNINEKDFSNLLQELIYLKLQNNKNQ